jgi:predicted DCC family thiol-disulfide oxidoreductase YuxK
MKLNTMEQATDTMHIIYDGYCPFCANYVKLIKLKETISSVKLINARDEDNLYGECLEKGYDLNVGMLAIYKGNIYHGKEAVHFLGLLTSPSGIFNNLNHFIFSSKTASTLFYPALRLGRNLALTLRGRKQFFSKK